MRSCQKNSAGPWVREFVAGWPAPSVGLGPGEPVGLVAGCQVRVWEATFAVFCPPRSLMVTTLFARVMVEVLKSSVLVA